MTYDFRWNYEVLHDNDNMRDVDYMDIEHTVSTVAKEILFSEEVPTQRLCDVRLSHCVCNFTFQAEQWQVS